MRSICRCPTAQLQASTAIHVVQVDSSLMHINGEQLVGDCAQRAIPANIVLLCHIRY